MDVNEIDRKRDRSDSVDMTTATHVPVDYRDISLVQAPTKSAPSSPDHETERKLLTPRNINMSSMHAVNTSPMFQNHAINRSSSEPEVPSTVVPKRLEEPKFTSSWDKYHDHEGSEVWEKPTFQKRPRSIGPFPTESEASDDSTYHR